MAQKIRIPRPRVKELRKLYKALITTSIALRIEALKNVLQWYDQAMPYVEWKLDLIEAQHKSLAEAKRIDRARQKDKIYKCRRLGIDNNKEYEQETAFLSAIRLLEHYCKLLRPWPIDKVYSQYELVAKKLEAKQLRLEGKFGQFLHILRALKPVTAAGESMRFTISDSLKGTKFGFKTNELIYSRDNAKHCLAVLRQRGALSLVATELEPIARAAAQEKNSEGHFILNRELQIKAMQKMLQNFVHFCSQPEAPKRLIKTAYQVQKTVHTNGHKPTGNRKPFGRGAKIDGLFVEGSAVGVLYSALKDGQWHLKTDLQKLINVGLASRLRGIVDHGAQGGYKIEMNVDKVRLVYPTRTP